MDGAPAKATTTAGGGGGPAPFLLKTYDMVDDSITDEIVSWSSTRNSFVVWNPPEFARLLLPTYFKHNNFSSFIRQLNTYGFRKIDPERWEFANEDFVKNQKELLKNIHRRKPIHSHSNPQGSTTIDSERAAFEEEIDKLTLEKTALENSLLRFKQKQPVAKLQIEDLTQRVDSMEQRQDNLLTFLEKAVQNPGFVDILSQKLESMDFSAYNKKRRLPSEDKSQMVPDDGFVDNQNAYRPEFGNVFHHDFANKLNLELSSAVSDNNFVSNSTQSSNEDGGSPQIRFSESYVKDPQIPTGIPFATEQLELTDTGTSFTFNMDSSFVDKTRPCEEAEGNLSCLLNLSLASSVSQVNASQSTDRMPHTVEEIGKNKVADFRVPELNDKTSRDPTSNNQVAATVRAPVNDVFWEQFLTEKPGSSDAEEASSNFREDQSTPHGPNGNSRNLQNLNL